VLLGDFLSSMPHQDRSVQAKQQQQLSGGSPAAAWGVNAGRAAATPLLGASPPLSSGVASLRMIQAEQEHMSSLRTAGIPAAGGNSGASRRAVPAGGASSSHAACGSGPHLLSGSSPPLGSSPVMNRWYIPDRSQPRQALTAIQTEEIAMTQLQQMYGSNVQIRVAQMPPRMGEWERR